MGFVEDVLRFTVQSESPRRYYYWSSLATISAVTKNQTWLIRQGGQLKLFPNIYVLLIGRSGLRKGPPVNLARALVTAVNNTKVVVGRQSIQALISVLSRAVTKENGGPPLVDATGALFASEFASFIISDPQALTVLTDLYDGQYNPEWTNTTKISGAEILKNPNITMLGASNEIHLKDALPDNAIGGGFLARTFIIFADKKSHSDPGVSNQENHFEENFKHMTKTLDAISKVRGQFSWHKDALELYERWYMQYDEADHSDDTTGTMERFHDHVLKVAMLVSLSRKLDRRLELEDVTEAIRACQDFIPGAKRVALGQIGKSISAPGTAVLLRELITHPEHRILRSKALAKHWQYFDSFELDRIAESLEAQKAIKIALGQDDDGKREIIYILNPKVLERYVKKSDGANDSF